MDTVPFKAGDHVRITDGTATVPKGWWGRTATVVEVEDSPMNESIGLQAEIQFTDGGLSPIVPVTCLEAA